jgi:CheY-like chemotaxis protein
MALGTTTEPIIPRILLVDDINMFLEIQKNMLRSLPVEIATAADGNEALLVVEHFQPDLIVMDSNMPKLDGIACCKALKQNGRHRGIPVIMTVPNCSDHDDVCRDAGCDALLKKPLDAGMFLNAVTGFIPVVERRERRVKLLAPAVISTGGREITGAMVNISRTGAFVEPDEPVKVGATVELRFCLPALVGHPLSLKGKVVRSCAPDAKGMHSGMGVAFLSLKGAPLRLPDSSPVSRFVSLDRFNSASPFD